MKRCNNNCGGTTCDKQTGSCRCCADGYWGQNCELRCGHCSESSCDKHNGTCQCQTGWAPPRCILCADFWYGENCNTTCNCRDRTEICNKKGGQCTSCPDGWTGSACDECIVGKYGDNCNQTCGNCKDKQCDRLTGSCLGGCVVGFTKPETGCAEKLTSDTQDNKDTGVTVTALAIVAVVSIAVYIVLTGMLVWYIRHLKAKLRQGERDSSKGKANHANDEDYENRGAQNIDTSNEADIVTNTGEPSRQGSQSTTSQSRDQNPQDRDNERGYVNAEQDI
ncbi:multiple epidermal growth factor-like domains protein 11 isoform X1 [Gigantopelta aegis]|uniref:multiple epidermal growth factor-like domains protein 11 isoform X1 n=1 Tax=Gigantopelta aegis TaxID=1735272 RepID=UPI001B88C74D|nr:multiple epidermal growth factor-like domains protein 11 isoform X1 [Gigantopelta aegis]